MKNYKTIVGWVSSCKKKFYFKVKKKKLSKLKKWYITSNKIYHVSRKFFQVIGVRVKSNFHKNKNWDQPLIFQNEV